MANIELVGKAVATAIRKTRKYTSIEIAAAEAILNADYTVKLTACASAKHSPEKLVELMGQLAAEHSDNLKHVNANQSAIRQQLEDIGVVDRAAVRMNAFQSQVKMAADALAKAGH